jgi:hypothetical protein
LKVGEAFMEGGGRWLYGEGELQLIVRGDAGSWIARVVVDEGDAESEGGRHCGTYGMLEC